MLCGSIDGDFFVVQLIFAEKTKDAYHPIFSRDITHSSNHWSNEDTMVEYIQEVIVPYLECVREELNKPEQAALAIFDNFKGQLTLKVRRQQYPIHFSASQLYGSALAFGPFCKQVHRVIRQVTIFNLVFTRGI